MTSLLQPWHLQLPQKAVTLREPWASAVMFQGKDIENRSRATRYRGRICVHAARINDSKSFALYEEHLANRGIRPLEPDDCSFGLIVGTVRIVDCVEQSASAWWMGPWGWVLEDPQPLPEPIVVAGQLGLFNWRDRLLQPTT